jgi:hypothetical protein
LAEEQRVRGVVERLPDGRVLPVEQHQVAVGADADAGDGSARGARRPHRLAVGRLQHEVARRRELRRGALPDGAAAVGRPHHLRDPHGDRRHPPAAVAVDDGHAEEEVGARRRAAVVGAEEAEGEGRAVAGGVEAQQRGARHGAVAVGDVVRQRGVRVGPRRGRLG